ncbi:plant U-box 45 [Artemisia annua]|uniref:Plant U-box 45 n=1 Tax=Artemisia annua TaxID=35608 RepID=A0A2U1MBP8_ARTAN|nr:plant U-box 45 [Artemisia annua]
MKLQCLFRLFNKLLMTRDNELFKMQLLSDVDDFQTKTILQHCAECSKIYLAITGNSVVLKFEKARSALEDGLRRVEDIVPQTIGVSLSVKVQFVQGQEEKAEA